MEKNIIVTIDFNKKDDIHELAKTLEKEGMKVKNIFEFGVITGSADSKVYAKLMANKNIISLKEDNQINLPSPDSQVQ